MEFISIKNTKKGDTMRLYSKNNEIKHLLLDNNLSIKDLAIKIGYNHCYLISIINGNRHVPNKTALLLSNALNVEVDEIFTPKEEVK